MKRLKGLEPSTFCMAIRTRASEVCRYGRFRTVKTPSVLDDQACLMPNRELMPNLKELMPIDEVFVKRGAQLAPNDAGPHPRAGVGQLHLPELSWAAELLQNVWGEIGELSLGELPATGTINDGPQRGVDGICRSFSAEHISRRIGKLRVEVDVRAPDLGFAHVTLKIHLPGGRGYTSACRGSSSETSACRLEARSLERPDGGRLGFDTPRGSIVRRLAEPPGAHVQDLRRGLCARRKA